MLFEGATVKSNTFCALMCIISIQASGYIENNTTNIKGSHRVTPPVQS